MQLLNGIRHVSFDLWLTLIKSDPAFKPARNKLFAQHFGIARTLTEVADAFRRFDLLFNQINERAGGNLHYTEMLYIILDHLGLPVREVPDEAMEAYYAAMEQLFFYYPPLLTDAGIPSLLERLSEQGCTINILSNTGFILGRSLRPLAEQLGIGPYFSFQLYSDEMGCSKPSAKVYDAVWQEAQKIRPVSKEQILHVGDNPVADAAGARSFGFRSGLLQPGSTLSNLFLN